MDIENIFKSVAFSRDIPIYEIIFDRTPLVGEGYTGHFYMGQIKNTDSGEVLEIAIKRTRFLSGVESIYKNENLFYSSILPALNDYHKGHNVPNPFNNVPLYFCGSAEQGKEYIAMENLKTRGYQLYDQTKYLDKKHLEYIFKLYGKFHALCFMFKKDNPDKHYQIVNNLTNIFSSREIGNLSRPIKQSLSGAILALNRDNDEKIFIRTKDVLENITDRFADSVKYNGKYSCINHGDCWSNNWLFKYDDSGHIQDVKLVDFQLCRETTPIHDLSYLFYSGASQEDFKNLHKYLDLYHECFSKCVKQMGGSSEDVFPMTILKKEWMQNALWGILMGIYLWEIKLSPKDKIVEIMGDNDTPVEEKYKKRETMIRELHKSKSFKEKTTPLLLYAFKNKIF